MPQIDALRGKLLEHGARLSVVKNTLTRRAAEAAGADALLALLEGPSAIAFIESEGDAAAVAKALSDSARETKVLAIRGGVMQGRQISDADVEELAKLPPLDVLRGQVLGIIVAPLTQLLGARERTAPEPDRADRRPHRAAAGTGRHERRDGTGRRAGAEPTAEAATSRSRRGSPGWPAAEAPQARESAEAEAEPATDAVAEPVAERDARQRPPSPKRKPRLRQTNPNQTTRRHDDGSS